MSGAFLYFFPGVERDKLTREQVQKTWLADVWRDELRTQAKFQSVTKHFVQTGPSGSSGIIACAANPKIHSEQPLGFYGEDLQTWVQVIADCPPIGGQIADVSASQSAICNLQSAIYLGFDRRYRPTPDSLQRERIISGYEVELGDGEIWTAPTIRKVDELSGDGQINLPIKMAIKPDGQYGSTIRADVQWAWDAACELWDWRLGARSMNDARLLEIVTRFLGLNYRVGPHEACALELFDSEKVMDVVVRALDIPGQQAWEAAHQQKKNQSTAGV